MCREQSCVIFAQVRIQVQTFQFPEKREIHEKLPRFGRLRWTESSVDGIFGTKWINLIMTPTGWRMEKSLWKRTPSLNPFFLLLSLSLSLSLSHTHTHTHFQSPPTQALMLKQEKSFSLLEIPSRQNGERGNKCKKRLGDFKVHNNWIELSLLFTLFYASKYIKAKVGRYKDQILCFKTSYEPILLGPP